MSSLFALDLGCSLWRRCSVVDHCRRFVHGGYRKLSCRFVCSVIGAQRDNPKERTENIPPKKRRYRCGKEAFGAVLMNEEGISSKCETRTTSERHNNKKIPETTGREKTTSTMVNDRQRLQTMGMRNQQQLNLRQYRKLWVLRWRWSHFRAPDPSRDILSEVSHTTTTKKRLRLRQSMQIHPKAG